MVALIRSLIFLVPFLVNAQMDYTALIVSNVPVRTPADLPESPVIADIKSIAFTGQQEVVIRPEGNDGFIASALANNYFVARIGVMAFAELKDVLDASYVHTLGNILRFRYDEKYLDGTLSYQIYTYNRTPVITNFTLEQFNLQKVVGTNFYKLDISGLGLIPSTADSFYVLEVTNSKGEVFKLRFKYML